MVRMVSKETIPTAYETIVSFRWCGQLLENFQLLRVALPPTGKKSNSIRPMRIFT